MKLKVTQENLTKALGVVARVANARGTLPILANVLLKVEDNQLTIAATNLDIAITSRIGSQVQKDGALTVPARLLQDLVSSLPSGVIELEQEENRLRVQTDHYKSVINGVAADDFPVMPAIEKGVKVLIPAHILKEGLQQVVFAASNDESRPVLTGVIFQTIENQLYIASTDSYRLAEKKLIPLKEQLRLLIPASALQDVLRIISDRSEDVELFCDEQQVRFSVEGVELVARLIEGNYPDYRKLIPESFSVAATMPRQEFVNVTKVTSLFARESAGSVVLSVDDAAESLWMRAVASQLGENNASVAVQAQGSGEITLNSRYILDALQAFGGKNTTIGFNGKVEAVLLSDPEDNSYRHLIMPLKS